MEDNTIINNLQAQVQELEAENQERKAEYQDLRAEDQDLKASVDRQDKSVRARFDRLEESAKARLDPLESNVMEHTQKISALDHKYVSLAGVTQVLKTNQMETDKWLLSSFSQKPRWETRVMWNFYR